MPALEQLGNWVITSSQGLYAWACDSTITLMNYLQGVGNALIGK